METNLHRTLAGFVMVDLTMIFIKTGQETEHVNKRSEKWGQTFELLCIVCIYKLAVMSIFEKLC